MSKQDDKAEAGGAGAEIAKGKRHRVRHHEDREDERPSGGQGASVGDESADDEPAQTQQGQGVQWLPDPHTRPGELLRQNEAGGQRQAEGQRGLGAERPAVEADGPQEAGRPRMESREEDDAKGVVRTASALEGAVSETDSAASP